MANLQHSPSSEPGSNQLIRPNTRLRPSDSMGREPRQPDWLLILMVSLFVLTLLIAWLVDIPALLRDPGF